MKALTLDERVALQMGDLVIKNISLVYENELLRQVDEEKKAEGGRNGKEKANRRRTKAAPRGT